RLRRQLGFPRRGRRWRWIVDALDGSDKAVAAPVHGLDESWTDGVVSQRLADLAHRLLDRGGGEVLDPPDPVQELLLREDLRRLVGQYLQHAKGLGTKAHLALRPQQPSGFPIEHELSETELHGSFLLVSRCRSTAPSAL